MSFLAGGLIVGVREVTVEPLSSRAPFCAGCFDSCAGRRLSGGRMVRCDRLCKYFNVLPLSLSSGAACAFCVSGIDYSQISETVGRVRAYQMVQTLLLVRGFAVSGLLFESLSAAK